jgi:hypothetical protein
MAGDAFKKVQPGQRLEITAEAFNAFLDAARAVREHKVFGTEASQFFRQSGIVKVKNASGADQGRFAVLGLRRVRPGGHRAPGGCQEKPNLTAFLSPCNKFIFPAHACRWSPPDASLTRR